MSWLEGLQVEVTKELLDEKKRDEKWDMDWCNAQFYEIFAECAIGKLKNTVMTREKETQPNVGMFCTITARLCSGGTSSS